MAAKELLQAILIDLLRIETILLRNQLQGVEEFKHKSRL